jgi:hypothetical protein
MLDVQIRSARRPAAISDVTSRRIGDRFRRRSDALLPTHPGRGVAGNVAGAAEAAALSFRYRYGACRRLRFPVRSTIAPFPVRCA